MTVSTDETVIGQVVELTLEKVLELIESAYPNPITVTDIAKYDVYYKNFINYFCTKMLM